MTKIIPSENLKDKFESFKLEEYEQNIIDAVRKDENSEECLLLLIEKDKTEGWAICYNYDSVQDIVKLEDVVHYTKAEEYIEQIDKCELKDTQKHERDILKKVVKYISCKSNRKQKTVCEKSQLRRLRKEILDNPWHTISEIKDNKAEIFYKFNPDSDTLIFKKILNLQANSNEGKFIKYIWYFDAFVFLSILIIAFCSLWELSGKISTLCNEDRLQMFVIIIVYILYLVVMGWLGRYRWVNRDKRRFKARKDASLSERWDILLQSSNDWSQQFAVDIFYFMILCVIGNIAIYMASVVHGLNWLPYVFNIYCLVGILSILFRICKSPIGMVILGIILSAFVFVLNIWAGITAFIGVWEVLLTKHFWMLYNGGEVPNYLVNLTEKGKIRIEVNLFKIKVTTSVLVLMAYVCIELIKGFSCLFDYIRRNHSSQVWRIIDKNYTIIVVSLFVAGFYWYFSRRVVKYFYYGGTHVVKKNGLMFMLYGSIYRGVKEVEKPIFKEKVGLSIAYLDKINPIQLLENSEALPKDIQVFVEKTYDPNKRKVIVIMPDLTVHSGIVEFEP